MCFVYDTNVDIWIGKSEENETDNEEEQTSCRKSHTRTKRACTTRFQLYRTQKEYFESQSQLSSGSRSISMYDQWNVP